ncbi:MAG: hypothetical protein AAFY76_11575, partial [Cyanobacteria bacterium J06649_11]
FKFINKRTVKFTLELFICITIGYLFFPFAVHIFRSYFTCYTGCAVTKIVAAPWFYHNRTVAVRGYLKLKFEGNVLYPLEEYYRYGFSREGIWVDINEEIKEKKNILNSKYVTITAKFNALEHGHGDLFIGTLKEIEKVELITPRRD